MRLKIYKHLRTTSLNSKFKLLIPACLQIKDYRVVKSPDIQYSGLFQLTLQSYNFWSFTTNICFSHFLEHNLNKIYFCLLYCDGSKLNSDVRCRTFT